MDEIFVTGTVIEEVPETPEEVVEEQLFIDEVVCKTMGVVSNCQKLNIRELPSRNSDVISVVPAGTELEVTSVADGWCGVCTVSGIEGYCMEDFVTICQ